jgi:hypothetical protein
MICYGLQNNISLSNNCHESGHFRKKLGKGGSIRQKIKDTCLRQGFGHARVGQAGSKDKNNANIDIKMIGRIISHYKILATKVVPLGRKSGKKQRINR